MNVVQAHGLCFGYAGQPVLRSVGFAASRGEFIALIGSNGAGKSTLLRILLGELSPDCGKLSLFGEDIGRFRSWSRIGYVPQLSPVSGGGFPATSEELVLSGLYSKIGPFSTAKKAHREQTLRTLELVGAGALAKRMISRLSGGELQRVMIARALVADCELLLLDEPSSGIDSESTERIYGLLNSLSADGTAVFMVTHDVARASRHINRALCLEEGTIVELGRDELAHELSHRHKHPI